MFEKYFISKLRDSQCLIPRIFAERLKALSKNTTIFYRTTQASFIALAQSSHIICSKKRMLYQLLLFMSHVEKNNCVYQTA